MTLTYHVSIQILIAIFRGVYVFKTFYIVWILAQPNLVVIFFFVVRCHILEVDLATQFSPYMMEAIRSTEQNCQKCVKTISEKCQQTQEI